MNNKTVNIVRGIVGLVIFVVYFIVLNGITVYQKGGNKMRKEDRKALLEERIKVITEKGKTKGLHNVITKLQRKLARENY